MAEQVSLLALNLGIGQHREIVLGRGRELLRVETAPMNSQWRRFHTRAEADQEYDYRARIEIVHLDVSPEMVREREYTDTKEIEDGWEYVLDSDLEGNATRWAEEAVEKLRRRYSNFAKRMDQTDNDELLERYLSAMTTGFDPHSSYMAPSTLDNFNITMKLELDGIGRKSLADAKKALRRLGYELPEAEAGPAW